MYNIKNCIYLGNVFHARISPKQHKLNYNVFYLNINLKEIKNKNSLSLLSFNKFNLFSFYDKDHGPMNCKDIDIWIRTLIKKNNIKVKIKNIYLLSFPRVLGYVFNPLSVYSCLDKNNKIILQIYEVHNTFNQRYFYLVKNSFDKRNHNNIYKKKFDIKPNTKIATAGSCFGQHVGNHLKRNGYQVIDEEIAPPGLPDELHQKYGFSLYSARYGNIYTVRQLLQLAQEVAGERKPENYIWKKNGKFFDALRPSVEPDGYDTEKQVVEHREFHIQNVKDVFLKMNLFIFTLGLTEMWVHKESGTVYPSAPGTIAGEFDGDIYEFQNAEYYIQIFYINFLYNLLNENIFLFFQEKSHFHNNFQLRKLTFRQFYF